MRLAVLASGRGSNLQAILDERAAGRLPGVDLACVLSDVPSAVALDRARAAGVEAIAIDRRAFPSRAAFEQALVDALAGRSVELVCLAGFMRLLSGAFLSRFPDRVVDVHPSLLPAFPGLHAVRQAIAYGVKVAGCTVHLVDEGTDRPVLLRAAVEVLPGDTEETLAARVLVHEHRLLPEALRRIAAGGLSRSGRVATLRATDGEA